MMLLGIDDLFELTSIKENATAISTLLDVQTIPVKSRHAALALGASHFVSIGESTAGQRKIGRGRRGHRDDERGPTRQ
jgi:hypothetical protein